MGVGGSHRGRFVHPRGIVIGVVAGIIQIALTVSFTSLGFRDELAPDIGLGLASMFIGLAVAACLGAMWSSFPGQIVGPQDSGVVVLSVAAPTIAAATGAAGETMVVLMGCSALAVGLTLVALGRFRLTRIVRYLPFPVLAGFLTGTGLVMGTAAIGIAAGGIAGATSAGGERALRIVVALAITAGMTAIARTRIRTERVAPVLVLGSIVLVHAGLRVTGVGRVEGATRGWLLPPLPSGSLVTSEWLHIADQADWSVVAQQLPALLPILLLAPLTTLLYLSALESIFDTDINIDREFERMGVSNLAVGMAGAAPAYTQFANTVLGRRMAHADRTVPLVVGLCAVVVLAVGDPVVALVPLPVVSGMLGFIAISFILDWTWAIRRRVTVVELLTTAAIAIAIVVLGFLPGIAIGLALTVAWFLIQYSRATGVRRVLDGSAACSTVERSPAEQLSLTDSGHQVVVVELEGFLFFGTGDSVLRELDRRRDIADVHWIVLDLRRVTGADSSAIASFGHLLRWGRTNEVHLIWCHLTPSVHRSLAPLFDEDGGGVVTADLDRAIEITERERLAAHPVAGRRDDISDLLREIPELREHAHHAAYDTGEPIRTKGDRDRGLTLILSGSVVVEGMAGARRRQLGPGTVLGEVSLYLDGAATATVTADQPCTTLEIDAAAVRRLSASAPEVAANLHRRLATVLAERLTATDRRIDALRAAD